MPDVRLPAIGSLGNDVRNSVGPLWNILYGDAALLSDFFSGSGIVGAQVYLEFLEAEASLGRLSIPDFHRELWYPIVIRKSQKDKGDGVAIVCGQQPPISIGAQLEPTEYVENMEYPIGSAAVRYGMVSYPVAEGKLYTGVTTISDGIISPEKLLVRGTHFTTNDQSVLFIASEDPFGPGSPYPRRVIENTNGSEPDEEVLLWATNVRQDKQLLYDHFGYAVDLREPSSPLYTARVNALWDVRYQGSRIATIRKAAADMLDVAAVVSNGETVEEIVVNSNGTRQVVTNVATYRIFPGEVLLDNVAVGAVLNQGEYLTTTIRLYHHLDTRNFEAANGIPLGTFVADVPSVFLPNGVVGNYTGGAGFVVTWKDEPITYHGDDGNGNPRLRFPVGAETGVADSYWEGVWAKSEARGESMADVLSDHLFAAPPYGNDGQVVGEVNPMQFYMDNALGANGMMLVVDFATLPPYITSLDVLSRLKNLVPAHILLLVMGRQSVNDETDLGETASDSLIKYHAVTPLDVADPAQPVDDTLTYSDSPVATRWIKTCR